MSKEERRRDHDGRYVEETSLEDILAVFPENEPLTSQEIAEELDITRRTALNKLEELKSMGEVHKKMVGARAAVWWIGD